MPLSSSQPDPQSVRDAAARIAGVIVRTPLVASNAFADDAAAAVLIKPEVLQHTGSFKFRGAYNRLCQLNETQRAAGVVAFSSGNHAQGVALAAKRLGISATIVMPNNSPKIKLANTRALGAKVVTYDRETEDRAAIAGSLTANGAVLVPPFDDPDIIAGQGTIALEIAEDAAQLGGAPDIVLVPCSGGGLAAGLALGFEAAGLKPKIYTVEPEGFDDYARSLEAGEIRSNSRLSGSILDSLLSPEPGRITFAINRDRLAGGLVVTEDEAKAAIAFAFHRLKLVLEPGGAAALAAYLAGKLDFSGKRVALVLSGGNIDDALFQRCLS